MKHQPLKALWLILAVLLGLAGCASMRIETSSPPKIDPAARIALLTLENNTSTPYAGQRARRQLAALLIAHGMQNIIVQPATEQTQLPVGNTGDHLAADLAWARSQGATYALTGSVDEWRYKIGLDGQPAVGFTLRLLDVNSGRTVWSGAAAASGGSREGLAVLSQQVLNRLLGRLLSR